MMPEREPAPGMMHRRGFNPNVGADEGPLPPGWDRLMPDVPVVSFS